MTYFWLNQSSGLTTFGHDTFVKQMLTTTKTSLQRAQRQALAQRTGIQPDRPRSHCPSSTHVPKAHPTTDPADEEAHDCPANDNRRAETTESFSNFGKGSYGGQHRSSELLQKSTGVSL